jgi:hypothetical protein
MAHNLTCTHRFLTSEIIITNGIVTSSRTAVANRKMLIGNRVISFSSVCILDGLARSALCDGRLLHGVPIARAQQLDEQQGWAHHATQTIAR